MGGEASTMREYLPNTKINSRLKTKTLQRLKELKERKYLNNRFFNRVTENMHYEIFKYVNYEDLVQIRVSRLGGYQLTSNRILRSRIKNYFGYLQADLKLGNLQDEKDLEENMKRVELIFLHTGNKNLLDFRRVKIKAHEMNELVKLFKLVPQIKGLSFRNIYIYIYYIYIYI